MLTQYHYSRELLKSAFEKQKICGKVFNLQRLTKQFENATPKFKCQQLIHIFLSKRSDYIPPLAQ